MKQVVLIGFVCSCLAGPIAAEPTLNDVLQSLYTNNGVSFTEVLADEIWFNPNGGAKAQAKYAGYTQHFGFWENETGNTFVELFAVSGGGENPTQNPASLDPTDFTQAKVSTDGDGDGLFRFGNKPTQNGQPKGDWYSTAVDNTDGRDHMRTFKLDIQREVSENSGVFYDVYALAWEDLVDLGDNDYQDLVVEVWGVVPVPVPGAALLGVLGLVAAGRKLRRFV